MDRHGGNLSFGEVAGGLTARTGWTWDEGPEPTADGREEASGAEGAPAASEPGDRS